ncbi:MAG TPA: hypothetical protein VLE22_13375 [Bryobacteraceae bacterium]|nr:hypothetical protein [Bryobacteraceae bacterium]
MKGERYRPSQEHIWNFGLGLVAYTWEEGGPSLAARRLATETNITHHHDRE